MALFTELGITSIHHYTPLHYLPFIARSRMLFSKPSLRKTGFGAGHLRSMSSRQDITRGFGDCAFLTLDPQPRILRAKLKAGFPHIALRVPASAIEGTDFSLCRYNIAMTRVLRRNGMPGRLESLTNGRYYDDRQIPIARTLADKQALLNTHVPQGTMIEVLIHGDLPLPDDTAVICFGNDDKELAGQVLTATITPWSLAVEPPPGVYNRRPEYVNAVIDFITHALANPTWRGNNLEFDRV
jgi:hypothetical protein